MFVSNLVAERLLRRIFHAYPQPGVLGLVVGGKVKKIHAVAVVVSFDAFCSSHT